MSLLSRRCSATSRRSTSPSQTANAAEVLELRALLTGLVMEASTFDAQQFAANIEEQIPVDPFGPNGVVGYSYSIIDGDPQNPISDAGQGTFKGYRRMPQDGIFGIPIPKTPTVPQPIASTSKPITAAAILHLLQEEVLADPETYPDFEAGMQEKLDQNIVNFLPANWGPGNANGSGWAPLFNQITIRELLSHTSGLLTANNSTGGVDSTPGNFYTGGGNRYNYAGLQQIAENGVVNVLVNPVDGTTSWPADYWTNNFSWLRVMVSRMWDAIDNQELNWNAQTNQVSISTLVPDDDLADELRDAIEDDWGIEPVLGQYGISPAQLTSSIFLFYVTKYLFEPAGVENPQANSSGLLPTLLYPINPGATPGLDPSDPTAGGLTSDSTIGDQRFNLGPRALFLSSEDHTRAITGIRHGATDGTPILLEETRNLMDSELLGWGTGDPTGLFGIYQDHGGGNFRPASGLPVMNNTHVMAFPSGVEASIQINSQTQMSGQPTVVGRAFLPATPPGTGTPTAGLNSALINAYDHAWTELVYDGDDQLDGQINIGDEHDTFRLALNANPQYIDFFHDNMTNPVFTRRIDTLTKITINGYEGQNLYQIDSLPGSIEVVVNGGTQVDDVTIGDPTPGVQTDDLDQFAPGTLEFNGGSGFSRLTVNDNRNGNPNGEFYIVRDDEVTRSGAGIYNYADIDELNLNTSGWSDNVFILGTQLGATTNVNTDFEADNVTIGNTGIDFVRGHINLLGSSNDTVRFGDTSSDTGHTYDIDASQTVIDGSVVITYSSDDLEVDTGDGTDTVNVNSLTEVQELLVETDEGQNNVNVNLLSNPITTSVLGKVRVHGGEFGNDTLTINDATSLFGTEYTITGSTVDRPGIQTIEYDGIETLNVNGAIPASSYDIEGTSGATNVTGGIFGDTFDVGLGQRLAFIDGFLTINGGDNLVGEDTVELNDRSGTSALYGVVNNAVFGFNFASIFLNDVEQATLNANALDNQFLIENAPGPTRYTINGWFGVDTFSLAETSQNLESFDAPLILNGGGDDNYLFLYDDLSPAPSTYSVTENSVDRLLFGEHGLFNNNIGVTFSLMNEVELHMNNQSSTVNVQSTNPNTEYIFYGSVGSDTLNLNRQLDDATDAEILIDGPDITGENIVIQYYQFSQLNVNLGTENTRVIVEDLDADADLNLGPGNDKVIVTRESRNLTNINRAMNVDGQGGRDRLILHDQDNPFFANYTISPDSVDRFFFGPFPGSEPGATYEDIDLVRLFMTAHDDIANVNGTASGTGVDLRGRRGNDTFNVNQPPSSPVTLRGGNGFDTSNIFGTGADDEVSVGYGPGNADVNLISIEDADFNGLAGTDVLVYQGVEGVKQDVSVHASPTAHKGLMVIAEDVESDALDLMFENTEILDLLANPGDDDTATFHGTANRDLFRLNLAADGTNGDPVLRLNNRQTGEQLLSLRDYRSFDRLSVLGHGAADRFDVLVGPSGPGDGRDLFIDGGSPTGPGTPRDVLNVFYQAPRPKIIDKYDPVLGEGVVGLEYETDKYFIEFVSIERRRLKPIPQG